MLKWVISVRIMANTLFCVADLSPFQPVWRDFVVRTVLWDPNPRERRHCVAVCRVSIFSAGYLFPPVSLLFLYVSILPPSMFPAKTVTSRSSHLLV